MTAIYRVKCQDGLRCLHGCHQAEQCYSQVMHSRSTTAKGNAMSTETIGMKVEGWYCYGMPTEPLTPELRAEVIEFARSFEECSYSRAELEAQDDAGIISAAYWAMADYARGQM